MSDTCKCENELVEIAPGVYKLAFPDRLNAVGAYYIGTGIVYNSNFVGRMCETIKHPLNEIEREAKAH